jgi:hypothetical protein
VHRSTAGHRRRAGRVPHSWRRHWWGAHPVRSRANQGRWKPTSSRAPPQTQRFHVRSGAIKVMIAGGERVLPEGDGPFVPAGTPHRWWVLGPVTRLVASRWALAFTSRSGWRKPRNGSTRPLRRGRNHRPGGDRRLGRQVEAGVLSGLIGSRRTRSQPVGRLKPTISPCQADCSLTVLPVWVAAICWPLPTYNDT